MILGKSPKCSLFILVFIKGWQRLPHRTRQLNADFYDHWYRHVLHYSVVQVSGHFLHDLWDYQGSFWLYHFGLTCWNQNPCLRCDSMCKPLNLNGSGSSVFRECPWALFIVELRMAYPNYGDKSSGCPDQTVIRWLLIEVMVKYSRIAVMENSSSKRTVNWPPRRYLVLIYKATMKNNFCQPNIMVDFNI